MDGFQGLLLPILIVVVIGIVTIAGWLTWYFTRARGRSAPADGIPAGAPASQSGGTAGESASPAYTLAVRRDAAGEWEIHVRGQRYFRLAAVPDAKLRDEAAGALQALSSFGGVASSGTPVEAARPAAPSQPAAAARARPVSPLTQRLNQATQTADADEEVSTTGATRRITPLHGSVPTIDFAYEINQILEELAEESAMLREHKVVLQNVPGGGITFFVDGTVYEDRTAIPNAEIRGAIEQATREWERR